jgi:hypothetical protein
MFLLIAVCLVLPATALLVTGADREARKATVLGDATPVVLGFAVLVVLVAAIRATTGRGGPVTGGGLVLAAVVFAVAAVGLLTNSGGVVAGVILLPAIVGTLALARISLTTTAAAGERTIR